MYSKEDCQMESKGSYDITASRDLTKSGDVDLQLSDEESDAIFNLARDAYNSAFNRVGMNVTNATFETIQTTVSFDGQDSSYSSYRTVEPGTNKTLYWTAFYQYSVGTLNGCTNDTLNNMTVTAAAPYYTKDDDNRTVIAGSWSASWHNTTESLATSTYQRSSMNAYSTALLSAIVGITLLM
ncbi:hypothetical protein KJ359_009322 [Pestalotiopsis sp. 9143b]|nr:hypothetical protein KJ359_009322 [Pestalotiopsis sp. 9143b]